MHYYPQLLTAAFSTISNDAQPRILGLTFADDAMASFDSERENGAFSFPMSMLPVGAEHQGLAGGESFLEAAQAAVQVAGAKCVFVFPPFISEKLLSQKWHERFGRLGLSEALAEILMTSLGPKAEGDHEIEVLGMLVPTHFASSLRQGDWRREFFPAHSAVVVEHDHSEVPQSLGLPLHAAVRLSTVFFRKHPGPIRFFKITDESLAEPPQRLATIFQSLLRQPAGKTRYGFVYQGNLERGYPCSYDYYSEETQKLREEIGVLGQQVALSSAADVLMGFTAQREAAKEEPPFLFINALCITRDGRVDLSDVQKQQSPSRVRHFLEDGDLCIRQIYKADGGFIVGVYEGDGREITFNQTVIVVRPHATLNPAQRQVLLSFLRSPLSLRLGKAKQSMPALGGAYRITPNMLRDFPVPLADEELVSTIGQLTEAREAFTRWITHIDEESNAILIESTATGSRRRLLHAGQLARQRHRAGEQVEELDYRIRTQFPHPLAFIWRELQVAGSDRYHRLRAVTKAAEGHTCFLALIAVLLSRAADQPIKYVNEIATRLSQRKSGTNFGDWFAVLKEANESKALRALNRGIPFTEIMQLCDDGIWQPAVKHLMALRNDDSHGRIAPTSVSPTILSEAEKALETIYRSTEFLTDYQLIFITDTRYNAFRKITQYSYRDLTGDNALAQLRNDEAPRSDLEKGSLYLRDRQNQLHLFRPLLQYLECPECHQMSTFFLDTYDPRSGNEVCLKSIERNSVRTELAAEDFRHCGFLK